MAQFFGSSASRINAIETGLSADPTILGMIPELDNMTLISNADAHSAGLNRVGREFTTLDIQNLKYESVIEALRTNKVIKTAEFHPTEGRYFLTGHRSQRKKPGIHLKGQFCYFSPKHVPSNDICPICCKEMTVGVLQRAFEISRAQGEERIIGDGPKRDFVTMVPLVEIIGNTLGISTLTSKKVLNLYKAVVGIIGTEVNLWSDPNAVYLLSELKIPVELIDNIGKIKSGNFCFTPGGFDGTYGKLKIGETLDFEDLKVITN